MSRLSLIGVARAPPIKLNRADPLRASLRSVGWHGKLQKNAISAPSRLRLISQPVSIAMDIKVIKIPNLTIDQLRFIYEMHKSVEMRYAFTDEVLGLNSGKSTAKEVEAILTSRLT